MFNYFKTYNANFGALIIVLLVFSQPAYAQEDVDTQFNSLTLTPGVYTVVLNGQIVDLQPIAFFFKIAQFGSTEVSSQSTPITPGSPRINGEPDHSAELTAQLVKVLFGTPSNSPTILPGSDTVVFDGQTVVGQTLNSQLNVGQFGFTPASNQPTLTTPGIAQEVDTPTSAFIPAAVAPLAVPQGEFIGGQTGEVDVSIYWSEAEVNAISACSNGTEAECDVALRDLVAAIFDVGQNLTSFDLGKFILTSFRQVIAAVRSSPGATGNRAIKIAAIDDMFAGLFPEDIATRPSSPS